MQNKDIIPAIIPTSEDDLKETIARLSFLHEIQIDVVDGQFVPFTSWPYEPVGDPSFMKPYTETFTVEIDLMVNDPTEAALSWRQAGAEMFVFHIETISLPELKEFTQRFDGTIGISANNDTPLDDLLAYAEVADYYQLMGIRKIGSQGQPFDEEVLNRIAAIKEVDSEAFISIDGSVNLDTIKRLKDAGADRFVSGSAILKAETPEIGYYSLLKAL
ncbi:hypothetical protein KC723_01275 [Candidatus Kaiserbacteria bacterium]|nr:hypothetical protein [Candidatus Kaiserbacteria bacterium]